MENENSPKFSRPNIFNRTRCSIFLLEFMQYTMPRMAFSCVHQRVSNVQFNIFLKKHSLKGTSEDLHTQRRVRLDRERRVLWKLLVIVTDGSR